MISPSLQLTGPFDVGNHVTSAFKLERLKGKMFLRPADRGGVEIQLMEHMLKDAKAEQNSGWHWLLLCQTELCSMNLLSLFFFSLTHKLDTRKHTSLSLIQANSLWYRISLLARFIKNTKNISKFDTKEESKFISFTVKNKYTTFVHGPSSDKGITPMINTAAEKKKKVLFRAASGFSWDLTMQRPPLAVLQMENRGSKRLNCHWWNCYFHPIRGSGWDLRNCVSLKASTAWYQLQQNRHTYLDMKSIRLLFS